MHDDRWNESLSFLLFRCCGRITNFFKHHCAIQVRKSTHVHSFMILLCI
jgi:hypothetical protein